MDVTRVLLQFAQYVAVISVLAFILERITQHVYRLLAEAVPALAKRPWLAGVLALIGGIPMGLLAVFDPLAGLFVTKWVGQILLGLMIGGGSNLVHDIYDALLKILEALARNTQQLANKTGAEYALTLQELRHNQADLLSKQRALKEAADALRSLKPS